MGEREVTAIVGVLGQWASGKSCAAEALIDHLGGRRKVVFLSDRCYLARLAVDHALEYCLDGAVTEENGTRRWSSRLSSFWLGPDESLETVDLNSLEFAMDPSLTGAWLNRGRRNLGYAIAEGSSEGKPIVIEAAFGTNTRPEGPNPLSHTIADLFAILEEAGAGVCQIKWIIVEASYEIRWKRNEQRLSRVPGEIFEILAADGGDLAPDDQRQLEEQGTVIIRVPNDHDDRQRLHREVIAAYERMV